MFHSFLYEWWYRFHSYASIANKKLGTKIHTFSVIDKDNRYDESKNILDVINYMEV